MENDPNPYASPQAFSGPCGWFQGHSSGEVHAECIHRSWMSRTVLLSGKIEAEIRYEAWGNGERVFVNNQLAARSSIWHIRFVAPHIDFEIDCEDSEVVASIDVRVSLILRITTFTLTVNGTVVYSE